jgi:DUF917 family protein
MKKNDLNKLLEKYQPLLKKTGKQLSKAMKSAEKDLSKMYQVSQKHVELQVKNLQKEKLYHEIGKYVAGEMAKGKITLAGLDKYKKRLELIDQANEKLKRKLANINSPEKKKTTSKPKASKKKCASKKTSCKTKTKAKKK